MRSVTNAPFVMLTKATLLSSGYTARCLFIRISLVIQHEIVYKTLLRSWNIIAVKQSAYF